MDLCLYCKRNYVRPTLMGNCPHCGRPIRKKRREEDDAPMGQSMDMGITDDVGRSSREEFVTEAAPDEPAPSGGGSFGGGGAQASWDPPASSDTSSSSSSDSGSSGGDGGGGGGGGGD